MNARRPLGWTRASTLALGLLSLSLSAAPVGATGTRAFRLTSYKDFDEGEARGVRVISTGELAPGLGTTRIDVNEAAVWCALPGADGAVYLGTGDQGAIWRLREGKAERLVQLDGVLVTSLAPAPGGKLFASVMPGGRLFLVDPAKPDAPRELAKLDVEHVWALSYDEPRRTLFAATGSKGQLWAVDLSNLERPTASLLVETAERQLLSLARADDGGLLVGTSDQALLLRVALEGGAQPGTLRGRVSALHDFEGDELRAIVRRGTSLYVAVNEFTRQGASAPAPQTVTTTTPKGTKIVVTSPTQPSPTVSVRDRKGKGAVWRVDADGRVEQLHALPESYFTALDLDEAGHVRAASGAAGRVYELRPDRSVVTLLDLPERQVLMLLGSAGSGALVGTGDAGGLYRLEEAASKGKAVYTTKVLDAQWVSRFGALRWGGEGEVQFESRSGNTAKPDATWSAWTRNVVDPAAASTQGGVGLLAGRLAAPPGRYLQLRLTLKGASALVRDLAAFYQPLNQRPRLVEVTAGEEPSGKPSAVVRLGKVRSPVVKVRWKAENPDEDELVYRVAFREERESSWRPLGGSEPLTRTDLDWNTESIPDGTYVVRVTVSDERANPKEEALEHALVSAPLLIDNGKPEVLGLRFADGVLSGRARDSASPLIDLALSIDGGEWLPVGVKDGLLDDLQEEFAVRLPRPLGPGAHTLAVRAIDQADNAGVAQLSVSVPATGTPTR